ncbi:MAG: hypothetical protein J6N21_09160 [Butyrivibrio sp.]|nr:hypothetical protein [Butyrivibrio sp.]
MVIVTLYHRIREVLKHPIIDYEQRGFVNIEEAEKWLVNNNFYCEKYKLSDEDGAYDKVWRRYKNDYWDYIDVEFELFDGGETASRYKDFISEYKPGADS